jgi:hypothetical protein
VVDAVGETITSEEEDEFVGVVDDREEEEEEAEVEAEADNDKDDDAEPVEVNPLVDEESPLRLSIFC